MITVIKYPAVSLKPTSTGYLVRIIILLSRVQVHSLNMVWSHFVLISGKKSVNSVVLSWSNRIVYIKLNYGGKYYGEKYYYSGKPVR